MTKTRPPGGSGRRARQRAEARTEETPPAAPLALPPLPPDLYINRELSWLAFNRRVLEEALDPATPLLERVKFAAICSSNLDEFFMIRVANLKRKLSAGIVDPGPDGRTPAQLAALLRAAVQELMTRQASLLTGELLPALHAAGIAVAAFHDLKGGERRALADRFERDIFPVLTPQAIDRGRRFPHVSNGSLNLVVVLKTPDTGPRYARIKIPAILPRLVPVPSAEPLPTGHARFVWLEDLVASQLERLFPGNRVLASYPFHVNRDSDIDVDEDEDTARDLLRTMEAQLSQRTFGTVVQLTVDATMPEDVRHWLSDQLHTTDRDLYVVEGPLDLAGLFELVRIDRPDLKDPPLVPAPLARDPDDAEFDETTWGTNDIFAAVRAADVLVHHPYQSFGAVTEFLQAAARDPHVVAIKQTLYRIGKDSPLIPALIEARDDDTQVAVLMELKARFDEENNIAWAHELEEHGVHVAYGLAGLKTHCKLTLVVRREEDGLRRYVHLATGNYNAGTARIYEDLGLLTARDEVAGDVSDLFNVLTGFSKQEHYRRLWVAPMNLRQRFLAAIARETALHERSGGGRIVFKMNSLVDRDLIRALYAASQAGVEIDLIVRGICCLRPGVPGWSERIRVRSVVGRFLEHSRVYSFANGGEDEIYLGSADLMERNLDRRVEVVFPIEDPTIKAHLRDLVLPAYLRDTVNARELRPDGTYVPVAPAEGEEPFDVHTWLTEYYQT